MKIKYIKQSILLLFLLMFLVSFAYAKDTATVLKVVDGDTLKILYQGKEESIRLIGIDTPESGNNNKTRRDAERTGQDIKTIIALGKQATEYTKSQVSQNDTITIEFDVQQRDKYGRLLGYIYLANGTMLNEEVVKAGYAQVMTYPPNVKYVELFQKVYRDAVLNTRGLWK